jgi:large subunit ribosomal protein L22
MEARAKARFARISARKARLVVDLIRGRPVGDALSVLDYTPKKAARLVAKTLRSAVANAENNQRAVDVDDLYVKRAFVDEGPTQKRIRPRAHGRANRILRRSSHVTVVVDEKHGES